MDFHWIVSGIPVSMAAPGWGIQTGPKSAETRPLALLSLRAHRIGL